MSELEKAIPGLVPKSVAQTGLDFFPNGEGAYEQRFSCGRETYPSFTLVLAAALCDPSLAAHDGERAREAGAVHRQDFAELALGDFTGKREGLQDGELRGPEAQGAQGVLVELGEGAGGAAESAT
jgi:hypothetical protein